VFFDLPSALPLLPGLQMLHLHHGNELKGNDELAFVDSTTAAAALVLLILASMRINSLEQR
jgi:hypothetical protein